MNKTHDYFMKQAYLEALKAYEKEEVPVGCVIVKDGIIIARSHNLKETKQKATAHAEISAIEKASKKLGNWRLEDCQMYVTLEPCPMCTGAIINSRIKEIYIAVEDTISGCCGTVIDLARTQSFSNNNVKIEYGLMQEECSKLLKDFFKKLRKK